MLGYISTENIVRRYNEVKTLCEIFEIPVNLNLVIRIYFAWWVDKIILNKVALSLFTCENCFYVSQ